MNTKPHGGETLVDKVFFIIGYKVYPTQSSTHYTLLDLHKYNISVHRSLFLLSNKHKISSTYHLTISQRSTIICIASLSLSPFQFYIQNQAYFLILISYMHLSINILSLPFFLTFLYFVISLHYKETYHKRRSVVI